MHKSYNIVHISLTSNNSAVPKCVKQKHPGILDNQLDFQEQLKSILKVLCYFQSEKIWVVVLQN